MTDTNSIFYRIGQSVKSTMNSKLDDYVPFSGTQSIDLSGSGNFGSLSVSGVPVVTGSSHSLYELGDVSYNHAAISDGQVLQWNGTNDQFEAATLDYASAVRGGAYIATTGAAPDVDNLTRLEGGFSDDTYHTAMTADNQFIAISYTVNQSEDINPTASHVGKVDIFKRNSDGTLSDRITVDLGTSHVARPIAIAKLRDDVARDIGYIVEPPLAPPATGGLILYEALSSNTPEGSGQVARAYFIPLMEDAYNLSQDVRFLGNLAHGSNVNEYAESISVTKNGERVALGCPYSSSDRGRVLCFDFSLINFYLARDYHGSNNGGRFGTSLSYTDSDLLAVKAEGSFGGATGAVIVIDDSGTNYSAVSANLAAGESPYEYKFSSAIFSDNASEFNDATSNSYHGNPGNTYNFIEITDLPSNTSYFGTPVLTIYGGETHLSIVTAAQGKVYSFRDQGTGSWTAKGTPFTSTVEGSNAYSIDSSEDGNTIVVAYNAFSSMSEFDFTGHQIKRFVYDGTNWDSGTIVANIPDAENYYNKFKSVLIASDGSFITTAMNADVAMEGASDGLFRVYEYQGGIIDLYANINHNHTLSSLSDLDEDYLTNGVPYQNGAALIWSTASGKWQATSNFLGNKSLNDLSDVGGYTNANLTDGEVLQWNSENGQFEAGTIAGADYSNGIEVDQFVATPLLSLRSQDMTSGLASINAEQSTQAGVGNTVKIVCFGGTVSIGDASAAGGQSDLTVTGNTTIGGNLTVNGTATTVNTTNLDVEDNIIKLNLNGGVNFVPGGIGGSSGIEIEAGQAAADGGNDRKARFVYNSGDSTAAGYGTDLGFFEATYEEDDVANPGSPLSGHLKMKVKGLEVQATSYWDDQANAEVALATPQFDNLGTFEDFMSGLNA